MKIHTVELPLGEPGRHEVVLLADHGQALAKMLAERDTAQAQLAEMRRVVAGFLFNYDDGVGKPWERRLLDYARKLVPPKEFDAQAEQPKAQGAQAGEFQREDRYIVIKRKDLEALEFSTNPFARDALFNLRPALRDIQSLLPRREYLVVESDWPEYEPTWAAIQARVVFADRRQVRDISEEEKKAIADRLKSLPPALRGNDHDQ